MLRHVSSALAGIALGAAIVSTPVSARGFGGGGHVGGLGGGHFGGGAMAHVGGGLGQARGLVGGHFAGPRVGVMRPLGPGADRMHLGGLHGRFRHRPGIGFVDGPDGYGACDWSWQARWRPYCDY